MNIDAVLIYVAMGIAFTAIVVIRDLMDPEPTIKFLPLWVAVPAVVLVIALWPYAAFIVISDMLTGGEP